MVTGGDRKVVTGGDRKGVAGGDRGGRRQRGVAAEGKGRGQERGREGCE